MKQPKHKIKIKKFRAVIFDADHNPVWTLLFTNIKAITYGVTAFVAVTLLYFCIFALTPVREIIPGYPDAKTKKEAVENSIKIDSLQRIVGIWELYSENILRALNNENPVPVDDIIKIANTARQTGDMSAKDSLIRQRVREEERFSLSSGPERTLPIDGNLFFTPVKGVVTEHFRPGHKATDIATANNAIVKSVMDGTVILTAYDEDQGYIIQIQHDGEILSVYKHSQRLLKSIGDKVTSGMPIAVAGNTGSLSHGNHLHLEIWYKGEQVNPEEYIQF